MRIIYTIDYPKEVSGVGITQFNEYRATAKVRGNDSFNLNTGKEIVRLKLLLQQLHRVEKTRNDDLAQTNKELQVLLQKMNKLMNEQNKINRKRNELTNKLKEYQNERVEKDY